MSIAYFSLFSWVFIFLSLSFSAKGENPLGGAMTEESLKLLQSQSVQGLGLTGETFNPVPPQFSRDGKTIIYHESPKGDDQFAISKQRVFKSQTDGLEVRSGEAPVPRENTKRYYSVVGGGAPPQTEESPVFLRNFSEAPSENETTYDANDSRQDFKDNWAIGNGWLGADFGYHVSGVNDGNTFSAAWGRATVLGQSTLLLGANLTTQRNYKNTAPVSDDVLQYSGNFFLLGQKTELQKGEVALGAKKVFDEVAHFDQTFYKQEWQYFIGPVPILIKASLNGKASGGKPTIEAGAVPGALNEISYRGYVQPYASLTANGGVIVGGFASIPENLLPAYVKGVVESDFIRGDIYAVAYGTSSAQGACLDVGLGNFRTMKSLIWGEAKWDVIQTQYVRTFVNTICNNGYITIPGCGGVQEILEQVTNVLSFKKRRDIYSHPGFDLGSGRKWLDIKSCKTNLKPTVVDLCNQSAEPIHSSLLLFDAANNSWKSIGWYELAPKACRKISLGNYRAGKVYAYAEYRGGEVTWAGQGPAMCVHKTDAFDISKGDNAASCASEKYKMVKSSEIVTPANQTATHSFGEADLSVFQHSVVKLCNKTFHDNIFASVAYFKGSWMSKGWWKLPTNTCSDVDIGPYEGNVFIHGNPATNYGASFGRGWNFCVDDVNAFEFPYADTMACTESPKMHKAFSMFRVKRGLNTYNFENDDVVLAKRVCNDSSENIWVATAWDETLPSPDGRRVVGSMGWWEVLPGKCMDVRRQTIQDKAYVFAKTASGKEYPKTDGQYTRSLCLNWAEKFETSDLPNDCPNGMVKKPFALDPGTVNVSFD